jgi:hypothetical protein
MRFGKKQETWVFASAKNPRLATRGQVVVSAMRLSLACRGSTIQFSDHRGQNVRIAAVDDQVGEYKLLAQCRHSLNDKRRQFCPQKQTLPRWRIAGLIYEYTP